MAWAILQETGISPETPAALQPGPLFAAAARCCEALARNFAMQADTTVGSLQSVYSKQAVTYAARAKELRSKSSNFNVPYVGGQSISEKIGWQQDTDTVPPAFRRDQFDSPYTGPFDGVDADNLGPPFMD